VIYLKTPRFKIDDGDPERQMLIAVLAAVASLAAVVLGGGM
jgi:hypothetical protein